MDLGQTGELSTILRRLSRLAAALTVLVVAIPALLSSPGSDVPCKADAALAQLAVSNRVLQEPPSERPEAYAEGAADSFEDDDLSCDEPLSPSIQCTVPLTTCSSPARRLSSGELARTYLARGPPSA